MVMVPSVMSSCPSGTTMLVEGGRLVVVVPLPSVLVGVLFVPVDMLLLV